MIFVLKEYVQRTTFFTESHNKWGGIVDMSHGHRVDFALVKFFQLILVREEIWLKIYAVVGIFNGGNGEIGGKNSVFVLVVNIQLIAVKVGDSAVLKSDENTLTFGANGADIHNTRKPAQLFTQIAIRSVCEICPCTEHLAVSRDAEKGILITNGKTGNILPAFSLVIAVIFAEWRYVLCRKYLRQKIHRMPPPELFCATLKP